ncbi:MAG: hypothetical protein AAGI71_12955 [Bacteroidota bacterium]
MHHTPFRRLFSLILVAGLALGLSACDLLGADDNEDDDGAQVRLAVSETLGTILTDAQGRSLYFFANDADGLSTCVGGCADAWPSFHAERLDGLDADLQATDFGTITRDDGTPQTTYKGWPLYYFAPDGDGVVEPAGGVLGEGLGSVWYVAKPDYTIMVGRTQLVGNDGVDYVADIGADTVTPSEGFTRFYVDAEGRTLYRFTPDQRDTNTFTAADLSNNAIWPIFYADPASFPSTVDGTEFGVIDVFGQPQLTWKGWPLYYFGGDDARGHTRGVSVPRAGVWPVVGGATPQAPGVTTASDGGVSDSPDDDGYGY